MYKFTLDLSGNGLFTQHPYGTVHMERDGLILPDIIMTNSYTQGVHSFAKWVKTYMFDNYLTQYDCEIYIKN